MLGLASILAACVHTQGAPVRSADQPSPERAVRETMERLQSGDIDGALKHYDKEYRNGDGSTLDDFADHLVYLEERGALDGLEYKLKRSTVELNADRAYVEVLMREWQLGKILTTFELKYDGAEWLIVHSTDF